MTFDDDDAGELNDWAPDLAGSRSAWRDIQRWGADGVVVIAQPDTNFIGTQAHRVGAPICM